MSSSNSQIRSPYHLRSRSKVMRPLSPASAKKNPFTAVENSRIKKMIGAREKLSFPETESDGYDTAGTEGVGGQFVSLTDEEIDKFLYEAFEAKGVIYTPPVPLSEEEEKRMYDDFNLELAQTGLSYLNDPAKRGPKYELVSPLGGGCFLSDKCTVYHFNFEAKLKNNPEAKTLLFFLEVVQTTPGQEKVTRCCSLGQSGSKAAVTGLNGCTVCEEDVHHPKKGRFIT